MIAPWPVPYSDETLYSWIARYRTRMRHPSIQSLMEDLFGSPSTAVSTDFGYGIEHLAAKLKPCLALSQVDLVNNHTLFPIYAPFLQPQQARNLLKVIEKGLAKCRRPPLNPRRESVTVPEFLRFCPECAMEERTMYGECYWHRLHQVPGIEVCARHEVWLESTSAPTRSLGAWHTFSLAQDTVPTAESRSLSAHEPGRSLLLQLVHDAEWLLQQPSLSVDHSALWKRYRFLLREQGLSSYRGKVSIGKLLARIHQTIPMAMLSRNEGTSGRLTSGRGLLSLLRKPRGGLPPLYHLLMIQLLGTTAEDFFHMPPEPEAFGIDPWPCLNPVAPHYRTPVVTKCSIDVQKDGARPVATFSCDCGFQYVRVGPDWGPLAQYSYTRVAQYGALWDGKFKRLWSTAELTLQFISQEVGIAEKNLSLHAARLKLPVWRREHGRAATPGRKRTWRGRPERPAGTSLALARESWITLCHLTPLSGSELREERRLYHWLFRHDHAWLIAQPRRPRIPRLAGSHTRVDWIERDQFLAQVLERPPLIPALSGHHRISINKLIRQSGYRHLIQPNLHRLPATRATLNRIVTSHMPKD